MRIRSALPLLVTLTLAAAGCGDGGDSGDEATPPDESGPSVTADEVRPSPAGGDTAGRAPGAGPGAEAEEAPARTRTRFAVQVGAFVRGENASRLRRRLEDAGLPVWTPTAEVEGRSFQRVRVGAAATVTEAQRLVGRIQESVGAEVWIAPVPADEELPADVVDSTRRALEGS